MVLIEPFIIIQKESRRGGFYINLQKAVKLVCIETITINLSPNIRVYDLTSWRH